MKTRIFLTALISAFIVLQTTAVFAYSEKGAEDMVLKGGSRGEVFFPHGRHHGVTVDCLPCHGLFQKESEIIAKMQTEGNLKKKEVMNMCKGCHKELASKGEKGGPTSCNGCHKK